MGKGDIKSRKGKLANGSFGKTRKRNETMPKPAVVAKSAPAKEKVVAEAKPAKAKTKKAEK
jgi:ribosomal small subunit protein bTHX